MQILKSHIEKSTHPKVGAQKLSFASFFLHKVVELVDGLNMPRGFTDNTAKIRGAEKLDEKYFGDVICVVLYKVLEPFLAAPVGNGGLCISGQLNDLLRGNNVLVVG